MLGAVAAASCTREAPRSAVAKSETIRIASFGGHFQDVLNNSVVQPIAAKLGINAVVETYGGEYDRLAATIRSGANPYDIVHVETRFLMQGGQEGLLAPIDWSEVNRSAFVDGATNQFGVGMLSWGLVLAWNADRLPKGAAPPSTWADLFDLGKYPGPRALRNSPEGNLEVALLADGVPRADLYKNGLDVERALRKLSTIRKFVTWWNTGAESEQKLTSSAALAAMWNGRVGNLKHSAGLNVGWTYRDSINQFDWWVIPINSAHKKAAMRFLAATADGTGQDVIAKDFGYGPVAKTVLDKMSPELRAETPSAPENSRMGVPFDGAWWAANEASVSERWNRWLLGK